MILNHLWKWSESKVLEMVFKTWSRDHQTQGFIENPKKKKKKKR
jgi:hypothetical protein